MTLDAFKTQILTEFDDVGSPGGMDYGMDMEGYGEEMGDMMDDYEGESQQQVRYKISNLTLVLVYG